MKTVLYDYTEGQRGCPVNGLSVYDLGDFSFGKPSRITAKTAMGQRNHKHRSGKLFKRQNSWQRSFNFRRLFRGKYAQNNPWPWARDLFDSHTADRRRQRFFTEIYASCQSAELASVRNCGHRLSKSKRRNQANRGVKQKIEAFLSLPGEKLTGTQGVMIPIRIRGFNASKRFVKAWRKKIPYLSRKNSWWGHCLLTGVPPEKGRMTEFFPKER